MEQSAESAASSPLESVVRTLERCIERFGMVGMVFDRPSRSPFPKERELVYLLRHFGGTDG